MFIATTLLISTPIVQSPRQPSTAESAHIFPDRRSVQAATSDHLRANFSDQPKRVVSSIVKLALASPRRR
jgi:hypothetical protein